MAFDNWKAVARPLLHGIATLFALRLWLSWTGTTHTVLVSVAAIGTALSLKYAWAAFRYHMARKSQIKGQLPPKYPAFIPYLGSLVSLAWDVGSLLSRATCYRGSLTSTRISILGSEVFVFQDRDTIIKMMKHPSLASPMSIIIITLSYLFGMPTKGLKAYRADDSGPLAKPFPGSHVAPQDRIDYFLHQAFNRAWSGPGLGPTTRRLRESLRCRVDLLGFSESWREVDDFFSLFGKTVIASLTHAVFGPSLLQLHPDLVDDLWAYDEVLPWLARGIPSFIMPGPYRIRDRVRGQLKSWYVFARQAFRESDIDPDGDGDPVWGSELVRHLQTVLHDERRTHDDDAMSAHDLALLWAANFNAVSGATLAGFHIFQDRVLLQRLRDEIEAHFEPGSDALLDRADPKDLLKLPLLSAIYAETLRLHVKVFFMASSPHDNVSLGKWKLPKGGIALVNSSISHTDVSLWNTKNGLHPLDSFWADRFLIDPADPLSGPVKPEARTAASRHASVRGDGGVNATERPYFSTEGLDGAWIPYGGGPSICPGRFLAKNVMFFTCALLVSEFDIEPLTERLELDPWRFGLGVGRPKYPVPVRVRKRRR
ncbi:cytochrome P450 [Bombardia bombarda]|uniref:Cytochrome P450 n=1 Tax=Bombardia bombarda TaxID=252184 RepID=A0AA39WIL7_9PEZI|nr:cytochrome P450 [Bombardia bombarda]